MKFSIWKWKKSGWNKTISFLSGFSFTNIHGSQDSKRTGKLFLQLFLSTTFISFTDAKTLSRTVTAESSPLHITSSQVDFRVHVADHLATRPNKNIIVIYVTISSNNTSIFMFIFWRKDFFANAKFVSLMKQVL